MNWQSILCFLGFHNSDYKWERTPFEEHGKQKTRASLVEYCTHCPNGRKVIVKRSLLLGD